MFYRLWVIKFFVCLETCVPQPKIQQMASNISSKKNDEVKQEQADSSNIITISEDNKKFSDTSNSDVTDSNEAEAKEVAVNEVQLNDVTDEKPDLSSKNEMVVDDVHESEISRELETNDAIAVQIKNENTNNLIENEDKESKEVNQTNNTDNFDISKERSNNRDLEVKKVREIITMNDNTMIKEKEVNVKKDECEDEDNIQDEELDHEVDEEEIKGRTDGFNQINDSVSFELNFNRNTIFT